MSGTEAALNVEEFLRLRRSILEMLYQKFQEFPYGSVELLQIAEESGAEAKTLNWNIVYLQKCGYVELGGSYDCAPYVAASVTITAAGIDLVEDRDRLRRRFTLENEAPDE